MMAQLKEGKTSSDNKRIKQEEGRQASYLVMFNMM